MNPSKPSQKKFRRRAEARPDEVLDAALEIFIAKGFAAARVEDIARSAGISKGAVYLYFPSKEAILEGLVKRAIVPMVKNAATLAGATDGDARAVLISVIRFIGGRMADPKNAAIPRIILSEAGNFPRLAEMYRREVIDRGIGALKALFRRGIESGAFRPIDPEIAVRSVIGPVFVNVIMAEVFSFDPPDPERFIDAHLDILMNGLDRRDGAV